MARPSAERTREPPNGPRTKRVGLLASARKLLLSGRRRRTGTTATNSALRFPLHTPRAARSTWVKIWQRRNLATPPKQPFCTPPFPERILAARRTQGTTACVPAPRMAASARAAAPKRLPTLAREASCARGGHKQQLAEGWKRKGSQAYDGDNPRWMRRMTWRVPEKPPSGLAAWEACAPERVDVSRASIQVGHCVRMA